MKHCILEHKNLNFIKLTVSSVAAGGCSGNDIGAGSLGFDSRAVKSDTVSPTTSYRCEVSMEF